MKDERGCTFIPFCKDAVSHETGAMRGLYGGLDRAGECHRGCCDPEKEEVR